MKIKTITMLSVAIVSLLVKTGARAASYTDADTVGAIVAGATSLPATFDIGVGDGTGAFGYATPEVLTSALVDFSFLRLPTAVSKVEITIGGLSFIPTIVSTVGAYTHIGGLLSTAMLADLSDGAVSYAVKNISTGPVILSAVSLVAETRIPVPDGSATIVLFGFSLVAVGLFGCGRKSKTSHATSK